MRKLTTEGFIKKAKAVHDDKYDYSKVEYVDAKTPVCIICPEHGEFWQTPYNHTSKKCECPKCSGNARLTTEEFISRAKAVHGDKYNYSKVEFTSVNKKVRIICPEHGEFWIRASHFLAGHGCPKCAGNAKLMTEDFIRRAKAVRAVRKFLISIGLKHEFADMYTVNRTGGGEWILDTEDNSYGLASVDIIVDDKLTLDDIRMLARHILTDEQLAEIGL